MRFSAEVNRIAVLIGGVLNMTFGALWYGPLLGKAWLKAIGKSADQIESDAKAYLLPSSRALPGPRTRSDCRRTRRDAVVEGRGPRCCASPRIGGTGTLIAETFEESPRLAWLLFNPYQLIVYAAIGLLFVLW